MKRGGLMKKGYEGPAIVHAGKIEGRARVCAKANAIAPACC